MVELSQKESERLVRECDIFCRYLVQQSPTDAIRARYLAGHAAALPAGNPSRLDSTLVRIASAHPLFARLTDAYARFVLPRSLLRVKLVLLLAILETIAPTEAQFRRLEPGPAGIVLINLMIHASLFVLTLLAAFVMFLPLHVVLAMIGAARETPTQALAAVERS